MLGGSSRAGPGRRRPLQIRLRGRWAILALLLVFVAPRFVVPGMTEEEAAAEVRALHVREITQRFQEAHPVSAPGDPRWQADAVAMAAAVKAADEETFASVRVRRGWMMPPLARRSSWYVEVRRTPTSPPEHYRIHGAFTSRSSPTAWRLRLP